MGVEIPGDLCYTGANLSRRCAMELLYFFESIRMPVLNAFMLLITRLGEETALLVVALILILATTWPRPRF